MTQLKKTKKRTGVTLSDAAVQILSFVSARHGISRSAAIEMIVREKGRELEREKSKA